MGNRRILFFAIGVLACVGVAWGLVTAVKGLRAPGHRAPPGGVAGAIDVTGSGVGGPFTLTDQTGKRVSDTDFRGRYMLIYFGYTYCPDVCPTELQAIARTMDLLGKAGDQVVPIFITVDPARDGVAQMAAYVRAFHPRLVGLTGSKAEIDAVAKEFSVFHKISGGSGPGAKDYLVSHTSFIYLVGPDGKLDTMFRQGTAPKALASAIRAKVG